MSQFCGHISIIGKPNVGKSTLLNRFLGQKLSITSRKPQTTRHQITGIKSDGDYQLLFVDTPGMHSHQNNVMNQYMNQAAKNSTVGVDVILFVVDALKWTNEDEKIANLLADVRTPIVFVPNKIDRIKHKDLLLPFIEKQTKQRKIEEVCPVSALTGIGCDALEKLIKTYLPKEPFLYPTDDLTNRSSQFIASERIREKLTRRLGDELPYALSVVIDAFEIEDAICKIAATVWVNKANQKGIVIGKKGAMLKSVGTDARKELEGIFGQKVFLKLWVKVREGWADDSKALLSMGYEHEF